MTLNHIALCPNDEGAKKLISPPSSPKIPGTVIVPLVSAIPKHSLRRSGGREDDIVHGPTILVGEHPMDKVGEAMHADFVHQVWPLAQILPWLDKCFGSDAVLGHLQTYCEASRD